MQVLRGNMYINIITNTKGSNKFMNFQASVFLFQLIVFVFV